MCKKKGKRNHEGNVSETAALAGSHTRGGWQTFGCFRRRSTMLGGTRRRSVAQLHRPEPSVPRRLSRCGYYASRLATLAASPAFFYEYKKEFSGSARRARCSKRRCNCRVFRRVSRVNSRYLYSGKNER